jgi:biotin carboxyl carrier protein
VPGLTATGGPKILSTFSPPAPACVDTHGDALGTFADCRKGRAVAELTHVDVDTILQIIDRMQGREVHLEIGDLKVHVTAGDGARATVDAPPVSAVAPEPRAQEQTVSRQPEIPATIPPGQVAVRAPTMGTFFRASSPGAKPYVETGDRVRADDTVCVFEVMKLFSSLTAGVNGTVTAILVANESLVEQDQPLILIRPD